MKTFVGGLILIGAFHTILLPLLTNLSGFLNSICIGLAPASEWKHAYQAIVCGLPLKNSDFKSYLVTTGLIHLIVVSGSHLVFLGEFTEKFGPKRGKIILLIAFTLITNLQPPTVRALMSIFLNNLNKRKHLFWTRAHQVFMSGIITLLFFPGWISSISFVMSWAASFALGSNKFQSHQLRYHLWVFVILFPIFLPLAPLNPISILTNLIFAPLVGTILFPVSILGFVKFLTPFTDLLWSGFDLVLKFVSQAAPEKISTIPVPFYFLWSYLFGLHIYVHVQKCTKSSRS
jgi:ComEC/Rec2-related protein